MKRSDHGLPGITPLFVCRDTGARLLEICAQTWDEWVRAGILPEPYRLGINGTTPRWDLEEVREHIRRSRRPSASETIFNLEALSHGQAKNNRSKSSAGRI